MLIGFSTIRYRLLVIVYDIRFLGAALEIPVTIGIEWLAYRATKRFAV